MSGDRIELETRGHLRLVGLNRVPKRNAFDLAMLAQLAEAFTAADEDPDVRVVLLHALGEHFTAGLDLAEVGPAALAHGGVPMSGDAVDPLGIGPRRIRKPVVIAVQGWCLTIGIELLLASDIRVAAEDTRFGQIEVRRGIFPFGGATVRFVHEAGWGNAMRHLLTGDIFDAAEAHRLRVVQEVVPVGRQLERAIELADEVAAQAPLAVQATLASARAALKAGEDAAFADFPEQLRRVMGSADAAEGMASFVERREARFEGR